MNIPESNPRFDLRKIESKRTLSKRESADQRQAESPIRPSQTNTGNSKVTTVSLTSLQGGSFGDGSAEKKSADKIDEARADEPLPENPVDSIEWPDDPGDWVNDREVFEEPPKGQEEPTGEQHPRKKDSLDVLETRYRFRFMTLDRLLERIAAAQDFLAQRMGDGE